MRRLDGFLVLGVPALLAMVALIVWKSHRANDVQPSAVSVVSDVPRQAPRPEYRPITVADLRRPRATTLSKTYYAYGDPLPAGYKCAGAGGPVYRVVDQAGVAVVLPLMVGGVMVRCAGDERSFIR